MLNDKNCVTCQVCVLRICFVESIDPDGIYYARYSYSGGQPHHINRDAETFEEVEKIKYTISEYADRYCMVNELCLEEIMNTKSRNKEVVAARRGLIYNIKLKMDVQNKHIASALGLTAATVSLALIKSAQTGKEAS
jgi:hypothetical protein